MRILNELPPIYDAIINAGMKPHAGVIYTYGDTIYNPSKLDIPNHLLRHEETHSKQQGNNPDIWWGRYLTDIYFRINQETEAYANQYIFICEAVKDRNHRNKILLDLSTILASPLYGNAITKDGAYQMIKNYANAKSNYKN